jgi:hypothetical protein
MNTRIGARFEFKIEDSWIGVYWRRSIKTFVTGERWVVVVKQPRLDVWICFVPWFPLHVVLFGKAKKLDPIQHVIHRAVGEVH